MSHSSRATLQSSRPVSRSEYLRFGLALMGIKYGVDALVFYFVVGAWWNPVDYLNPIYAQRMAAAPVLRSLPVWYPLFLMLWGLAFAWIGGGFSTSFGGSEHAGRNIKWTLPLRQINNGKVEPVMSRRRTSPRGQIRSACYAWLPWRSA